MDIDRVMVKTVSLFKGDLIAVEFSDNASPLEAPRSMASIFNVLLMMIPFVL